MGVRDGERGVFSDPFLSDEEEIRQHKGARDWHLEQIGARPLSDEESALLTLRSPAVIVHDEDLLERPRRRSGKRDARSTRSTA